MNYEKPLVIELASGAAFPACTGGTSASIANPGCDSGGWFGPTYDCGNGSNDDYCFDGTGGIAYRCNLGTAPEMSGTRCIGGNTPS